MDELDYITGEVRSMMASIGDEARDRVRLVLRGLFPSADDEAVEAGIERCMARLAPAIDQAVGVIAEEVARASYREEQGALAW